MMISENMAATINDQIKFEFYSAWVYRAMAYAFEDMGLKIFAQWFYTQAREEVVHAEKFAQYLLDQGARVILTEIDAPKTEYGSAAEIVQEAVDHELMVTRRINGVMDIAKKENDHATQALLNWFVEEQVEEIASTTELLQMVKLAGAPGQLLLLEDRIQQLINAKTATANSA